jgi:ribosomal protein L11 methyltransferase
MTTTVARLACDEPAARRLLATLGESLDADDTVCSAFEGDGGQWQLAIHFRDAPDEKAVRALVELAAGDAVAKALCFEALANADWVAQSLVGLPPVRVGRFVLHGAHDRVRIPINAIGIEIEAALAFGTGHHGTTRGCLLALDQLAKRQRRTPIPPPARGRVANEANRAGVKKRPPPRTILDVGTGSGVLAIAAAKVLRTVIVASDIDRQAVATARANAQLNRAANFITLTRAAGVNARDIAQRRPYDLIFTNILLGPILRLAVPLARLSRPGASLVLSGLLPAHANAVLAITRAQGLALERRILLDGWVTLMLKSPPRRRHARQGGGKI